MRCKNNSLRDPFLRIFALSESLSAGLIKWPATGEQARSLLHRTISEAKIRENAGKNTF